MNQILFLNIQYLKDFSTIDLNVDDKLLISSIAFCQEEYIKPILGTGLYDDLKSKVQSGSITGNNQTLIQTYVQPALASYVLYDVSDFLLYKFSNKAIEKQRSDTTEPISLNELNHLKGKLLDRAQVYGTRTTNYLMANNTLFPLFDNPGNSFDTILPNRTDEYMYGIYTPKKGKRKFWGWDLPENQNPLN